MLLRIGYSSILTRRRSVLGDVHNLGPYRYTKHTAARPQVVISNELHDVIYEEPVSVGLAA